MMRQLTESARLLAPEVTIDAAVGAEIGLFRGADGYRRLYVLAADGSGSMEFVHNPEDDPQESTQVLLSLVRHAFRMIDDLDRSGRRPSRE